MLLIPRLSSFCTPGAIHTINDYVMCRIEVRFTYDTSFMESIFRVTKTSRTLSGQPLNWSVWSPNPYF